MSDKIELAEQKFNQFLPMLKERYPAGRKNKESLQKVVEVYQKMTFSEDIIVALFDHRTLSFFFISDNIAKLSGYNPKTMYNWGGASLFKIIHPSHYSYANSSLKWEAHFSHQFSLQQRLDSKFYCCGLKAVDKYGKLQRIFLKGRKLSMAENNFCDTSIFFVEDLSHLIKGNNYWLRMNSGGKSFAYVHQKGKKIFNDLISDKEKSVLHLLAEKKTTAEIADELKLSKLTVETHRKNMVKRTGAVNSTALVHICKMAGII